MDRNTAIEITGGLSHTTKMPCASFSLPAYNCAFGVQKGYVKDKSTICSHCYARKGRYLFPNVRKCLEKRLAGITHPDWVDAMVFLIKEDKSDYFRWHDSGEIVDMPHLLRILQVVEGTPEKKHWLPTKQTDLITDWLKRSGGQVPPNLLIRMSSPYLGGSPKDAVDPDTYATEGVEWCTVAKETPGWMVASEGYIPGSTKVCPAIALKTGKCGSCRACWSRNVRHVLYPQH